MHALVMGRSENEMRGVGILKFSWAGRVLHNNNSKTYGLEKRSVAFLQHHQFGDSLLVEYGHPHRNHPFDSGSQVAKSDSPTCRLTGLQATFSAVTWFTSGSGG